MSGGDMGGSENVGEIKLKPCRYCGKSNFSIERFASGKMMVKCINPDCSAPFEAFPTGRNLIEVIEEWNLKQSDDWNNQGRTGEGRNE